MQFLLEAVTLELSTILLLRKGRKERVFI